MFEALKDKLEAAFARLRGKGKLSEADVDLALRELRKSLLEADVDFKVVRDLVARIRERAVQLEVLESISAAQHISTVVYEELVSLMGDPAPLIIAPKPPTVILMAGLQGSGKTTTTVKLARRLKDSHKPLVVACDLRRPAAVEQLRVLAEGAKVSFYGPEDGTTDVLKVVRGAERYAAEHLCDIILLDTAGRAQRDKKSLEVFEELYDAFAPDAVHLVLAANMKYPDMLDVVEHIPNIPVSHLIFTKLDETVSYGAIFNIQQVMDCPVSFLTAGQNVPKDIETASGSRIAEFLMMTEEERKRG